MVATPSEEEELEEVFIIQAEKLPTNEPGKVYVAFQKMNGAEYAACHVLLPTSSRFTSKEIDPSTGEPEDTGYDDEYEVSEFDLARAVTTLFRHLRATSTICGSRLERPARRRRRLCS